MRIRGEHLKEVEPIPIPIFRGEETEYLLAGAVDFDEFEELCPSPKPPSVMKPGQAGIPDFSNPKYVEAASKHGDKRIGFMVFTSLQATEGIEWEFFDKTNPDTYTEWQRELKAYGLTPVEISRVLSTVIEANSLSEDRVIEARKSFLATRRREKV